MNKQKILIIEDETIIALNIQNVLEMKGYEVCDMGISAEEAIKLTEKYNPDLIIMDIILDGEKDGIFAVEEIKKKHDIPVVYLTAHSNEKTVIRAKKTEPHGYIIKPISQEELLTTVEIALYKHEMEGKLKESEERLELVLEGSQLGFWDWDIKTNQVQRNLRWAEMLGYTLKEIELSDKQWTDLHHPEDRDAAWQSIQDHLEGRTSEHKIEYRMRTKDGHYKWILDQARIVKRDSRGEPLRMSGTHTDITERKKREEELKKHHDYLENLVKKRTFHLEKKMKESKQSEAALLLEKEKLENVTRNIGAGLCIISRDYRTIWANEVIKNIFGDVIGKICHKTYNQQDEICQDCGAKKVFETGIKETITEQVGKDVNGNTIWSQIIVNPLYDKDGNISSALELVIPITERKQAEEHLIKNQIMLKKAEEISNQGSWEWDIVRDLWTFSDNWLKIHGCKASGISQKELKEIVYPEDAPNIDKSFQDALAGIKPYNLEHRIIRQNDRETRWVKVIGEIVLNDNGEPVKMYGFAQDISDRKKTEAELNKHRKHLGIMVKKRTAELEREITERNKADEALKKSEEKYKEVVEGTEDLITQVDAEGKFIFVNCKSEKFFGISPEECLGLSAFSFVHPDDSDSTEKQFKEYIKARAKTSTFENRHVSRNGEIYSLLWTSNFHYDEKGKLTFINGIARDITERKNSEQKLLNEKILLKAIIDNIPVLIIHYDPYTNMLYINKEFEKTFGWKTEDAKNIDLMKKFYPDPDYRKKATEYMLKASIEWKEFRPLSKFGKIIDSKWSNISLDDGTQIGIGIDITEHKKAEKEIKASLKEKETLLSEIHHRVKNNMQVITSLLNLQSTRIKDEEARRPFTDCENRIRSMALVHEKLYQSKDLANIDFREYVTELTQGLQNTLSLSDGRIPFEVDVKEQYLDATKAIPCGQIITELVSNTLKHAFPDGKKGKVAIDFKKDKVGNYTLTVKDNGAGLPDDFDNKKKASLGYQLVNALVKQLKGEMEVTGKKGTKVTITFPGE